MEKILFMNFSPNKEGNTFSIGEKLLEGKDYDAVQMSDYKISQYGQVFANDQIKEVFDKIKDYDTLVIGTPVYWYTVSGLLKTFIDRLYMLPEAEGLNGKNLYLFAQGSGPGSDTVKSITFLANRLCTLMGMNLKGVCVDTADGRKILSEMAI